MGEGVLGGRCRRQILTPFLVVTSLSSPIDPPPEHARRGVEDATSLLPSRSTDRWFLGDDGNIEATNLGFNLGIVGAPYYSTCPTACTGTPSDDCSALPCGATSTSSEDGWDYNFYDIEGENVSSLGAPEVESALQQATAVQAAVGRATAAAQRATGHAAAMHYELGDATVENMAASDPHQVSRGLSSPTNLGGFGEGGSLDVEELAVNVGVCKADRFVAYEAEEAVQGEKRG